MAKTNPIGVRFRQDLLDHIKAKFGVDSPQKALVFYERMYVQFNGKISSLDILRENKEQPKSDETHFMGELIPEGLTGIPLAVWKNNIKMKSKKQ